MGCIAARRRRMRAIQLDTQHGGQNFGELSQDSRFHVHRIRAATEQRGRERAIVVLGTTPNIMHVNLLGCLRAGRFVVVENRDLRTLRQ